MITQSELTNFLEETGWSRQKLAEESGVSHMTIRRILGEDKEREGGCKTFDVYNKLLPFLKGDKHPRFKDHAA